MEEIIKHNVGTFCWLDLATVGAKAAKTFYCALFGWEAVDMPAGEGMTYTMLNLNGKPVAGLYEMGDEQKKQNTPPHWMNYIAVDDVQKVSEKVKEQNGTVIMPPMDVLTSGRMALIQDTSGGLVALWQPKEHQGVSYKNVPGSLSWVEYATHQPDKSKTFYTKLFGWDAQTIPNPDMEYILFMQGAEQVAGMYKMTPDMKHIPAHWLPYLSVADCKQSTEKAKQLGGELVVEPKDIGEFGVFAIIRDPQGAVIAIIAQPKQ